MDTSSNAGHRRRPHQAPERRLAAKNLGRLFGVSRGSSKALSWQEHRHAVLEMTKGYARERGGDRARNTRQPDMGWTFHFDFGRSPKWADRQVSNWATV